MYLKAEISILRVWLNQLPFAKLKIEEKVEFVIKMIDVCICICADSISDRQSTVSELELIE
jgi:hypothetical protein